MRRPHLLIVPLLALGTLLAACGESTSDGAGDRPAVATPPKATGAEVIEGAGTFPVTVEHRFGSTTVESDPQRIVSVGLTEQDILLQLGKIPVAVTEWYGEQPDATWPWAHDLLGDSEPVVLSTANGIEFEKVAELEPDLIVGTNAGMTERDYELLSQIAPTVTSVPGSLPYFSPWQDQTLQVARALGREADGQELIDRVEADYAAVAEFHADEWAGRTATFSQGEPYDGQLYVYPDDLSTAFLTQLGFSITEGLDDYAEPGEQALISGENVDLIDADVIVWATENQKAFDALQAFSTVSELDAVAGNRSVYTDATLAGAIYFLTPLSLEYVLDQLPPLLEQAVRGEAPRAFPS